MALPHAALLDTSVLLRLFHDQQDALQSNADALREALRRHEVELYLLDLSIYEFVNVVVSRLGKNAAEASRDVEALYGLGLPLVGLDLRLALRAAEIAAETGLSGYDASFVAAAELLGVPLVTSDTAILDAAGPRSLDLADVHGGKRE